MLELGIFFAYLYGINEDREYVKKHMRSAGLQITRKNPCVKLN